MTWLVVADGEAATIYVRERAERRVPLRAKQEATREHFTATVEWQLRPLRTARAESLEAYDTQRHAGRSFEGAGQHRHHAGEVVPLQQQLARRFMDELAEKLNQAFRDGEFNRLVLTAPPKSLGELRAKLDAPVQAAIVAELPKNLSHETPETLVELLNAQLGTR